MSWFPQFLNPLAAGIAAAIAIPALLALYFLKLRRQERSVASTLLWKKAIQDLQVNAPFQKLRRNLLLLLQLFLLALLILALSRPVVSYAPPPGQTTVILIDRSASMSAKDADGRTRLDEAKRRAEALIDSMSRGARAMVIAFADDSGTQTVQPFTQDRSSLRSAIESIMPTDRKSQLKVAYQLAEAQMNYNPEQLRENREKPDVWVYSDGRVLDAGELSIRGNVRYEPIGSVKTGNLAVVALSARRNYERPNEVQVFARLANFGTEPADADVQISVDGDVRSVASTYLIPERWTDAERKSAEDAGRLAKDSVEFTVEMTTAGVIKVQQMNRTADALSADDSAEVVVPPPRNLAVLLVTNGNYFLERAVNSLGAQKPDVLLPAGYESRQPLEYDVVIFDSYTPKFVPPAGSFISFGSVPPGIKLLAAKSGELPMEVNDVEVLDWKRDHPILRGLSLAKVFVAKGLRLLPALESEVLVEGTQGPLIVLHREGRQTHLVVSFDVMQSNWPLRMSFPVFLHGAMQFLAIGSDMDVRQSLPPGASPRISRANIQRVDPNLKSIRLNGPAGSREVDIPETGDFALPPLDKVGLYTIDPPIPQFEQIAVNLLDPNESNLLPLNVAPGDIGEVVQGGGGKARLELWWWLVACAALPLLLIEWWVHTRRVHL